MPWYDDLEGPSLEFAASESPRIRALAGPGTGKTFSLTRRVQRLLEEGVHPTNILVVTLTRTAADDLRRGLDSLGVGGSEAVHASTLHSLCFSILSQEEVFQMTGRMTRLLAMFERDILLKDLPDQLGTITQKKSLLVQYEAAWAGLNGSPLGAPPAGLPHEFQNALINYFQWHKCMLVGELVPLAYTYLSQNPYTPILQRFDHILVDEYQDLNRADQAVIELLAASSLSDNRGQLAIIGDDDQSIYVLLRSAHPRGIIEFPADHDVSFVECGRCPRSVVEIAQNLIEHNPERARGPLVPCPGNPEGEIFNVVFETMEDEAEGVARFVDHRIRSGAVDPGEVLIIANWREIAYRIRDRLIELGNDAHSYFSEQALDHRNAQRVLTLLTLLADASDRVALRSWLALSNPTTENRAAYRRIYQYSLQHGLTAAEVILRLAQGNITITHTQSAVDSWNELQEILFQLQRFGNDITALINYLLPEPLEGTTLLLEAVNRTLASIDSDIDLRSFIDELRKQIGMPEVPMEAPFVRIMSLHKSKGLSANLVVIAGLVDGLIPRTPRGDMNPEYLEEHFREQRRVLFVGVTRTRQTLVLSKFQKIDSRAAHISGAQTGRWAGRGIKTTIASRFLGEFGPSLPRAIRGDRWEYQ